MSATRPLSAAVAAQLEARAPLTVSEWADRYRVVPRGTSAEPGAWRTSRAPYLREILDAASDPSVERIIVQAASQIGKTEVLLSVIGYYAHQDPSPILLVQPTEVAMRAFSKERIAPMFDSSPALRGHTREGVRDPDTTVMQRNFAGGYLACAWAGSASSLASRSIRVLLGDELDRWPEALAREGDPWAQAVQRTSNWFNRKIIAVSTPTVEGRSSIARLFEETDRRRFWLPCPRCGALQVLEWGGVIYKRVDGSIDLDDIHYRCEHCSGRIEEREKPAMLADGEWRPDGAPSSSRGYAISALYSPWVRWREIAAEWIRVRADRDLRGQQEWTNLRLGEVWLEEENRITVESLEKNREGYEAELPEGALVLTCGVDVQDARLEAEIVGWGVGRESWGVEYAIIGGDTSDVSPAGPWARLTELLARSWKRADGSALAIFCTCIDSGGHRTDEVYRFCYGLSNVRAIKGRSRTGYPIIVLKPSVIDGKYLLHNVGVDGAKDVLFSRLGLEAEGPGYCHFPTERSTGYDDTYFRGLISERKKKVVRAGRVTTTWVQTFSRNEPLDCRVYATAALELAVESGLDLAALAAADDRRVASPSEGTATARDRPVPSSVPRRRVYSRGVG